VRSVPLVVRLDQLELVIEAINQVLEADRIRNLIQ
jgi:hypothetical protein